MLLWYTLSLNGMLKASRRFGYVTSTGFVFPFFQVPSFNWRSIRIKFSSPFKTNDFTDGFQATPFLHFIIESYKLSKSVILFILYSAVSQCWQASFEVTHCLFRLSAVLFRLYAGDFGSLSKSSGQSLLCNDHGAVCKTIGAYVFEFHAFVLLTPPSVFTFMTLLALPRLAERENTF